MKTVYYVPSNSELYHFGIPGMKWGVRRGRSTSSSGGSGRRGATSSSGGSGRRKSSSSNGSKKSNTKARLKKTASVLAVVSATLSAIGYHKGNDTATKVGKTLGWVACGTAIAAMGSKKVDEV